MTMSASAAARKKADAKVIILGDYAVGKTCLINRYISGKFSPQEPTIGAAFFLKQWGAHNVAVWDTAGDEKYTGLSSFYCRNAGAAILAFDLNTASTYESLWARFLPLLESAKEDCLKVVVGTKQDLLVQDKREISIDEAVQFSREVNKRVDLSRLSGDPYFETSAKTGFNVDNVFEFLFKYCLPQEGGTTMTTAQGSTLDLGHGTPTQPSRGCCR